MDPKHIRKSYQRHELKEDDIASDPFQLFEGWYKRAIQEEIEPTAMVLATAADGIPNARVVLLKGFDDSGFVFFTNYKSAKGEELANNPHVSLNFHWLKDERQVRIKGVATKVSKEESDEYFNSRPVGSRLGAIASAQSAPLESPKVLVDRMKDLEEKYKNEAPPRPEHWGGYRVEPSEIEFWQGRPNRLHDRFLYKKKGAQWSWQRLSP